MSYANFLHSVSRVYHDIKLDIFVRKAGTENCEARFRMSRQQERIVRKHFGIRDDLPIQFSSSELAEVGNGWWVAFSLSEKADEALKAILNIKAAFYYAQTREIEKRSRQSSVSAVARDIVSRIKPKRVVLVHYKPDGYGHLMPLAVNRSRQALENPNSMGRSAHISAKIKSLVKPDLQTEVDQLRHHFGK